MIEPETEPQSDEETRGRTKMRAESTSQQGQGHRLGSSCRSTSPLIRIISPEEMEQKAAVKTSLSRSPGKSPKRKPADDYVMVKMAYNEYGELVDELWLNKEPDSESLNVTQLLRTIKKRFHHDVSAIAQKKLLSTRNQNFKVL